MLARSLVLQCSAQTPWIRASCPGCRGEPPEFEMFPTRSGAYLAGAGEPPESEMLPTRSGAYLAGASQPRVSAASASQPRVSAVSAPESEILPTRSGASLAGISQQEQWVMKFKDTASLLGASNNDDLAPMVS